MAPSIEQESVGEEVEVAIREDGATSPDIYKVRHFSINLSVGKMDRQGLMNEFIRVSRFNLAKFITVKEEDTINMHIFMGGIGFLHWHYFKYLSAGELLDAGTISEAQGSLEVDSTFSTSLIGNIGDMLPLTQAVKNREILTPDYVAAGFDVAGLARWQQQ